MEQSFKKRFIEWRDIDEAVERLASNIESSKVKIGGIHGIARGGLIPATMLSHRLGIPYMNENDITENYILIVDDICDTGHTLEKYSKYESILIATLHYKTSAIIEPDFWWKMVQSNEWIVYPWERKDSKTIADYAAKGK